MLLRLCLVRQMAHLLAGSTSCGMSSRPHHHPCRCNYLPGYWKNNLAVYNLQAHPHDVHSGSHLRYHARGAQQRILKTIHLLFFHAVSRSPCAKGGGIPQVLL